LTQFIIYTLPNRVVCIFNFPCAFLIGNAGVSGTHDRQCKHRLTFLTSRRNRCWLSSSISSSRVGRCRRSGQENRADNFESIFHRHTCSGLEWIRHRRNKTSCRGWQRIPSSRWGKSYRRSPATRCSTLTLNKQCPFLLTCLLMIDRPVSIMMGCFAYHFYYLTDNTVLGYFCCQ
jgi:hypothetical protein